MEISKYNRNLKPHRRRWSSPEKLFFREAGTGGGPMVKRKRYCVRQKKSLQIKKFEAILYKNTNENSIL